MSLDALPRPAPGTYPSYIDYVLAGYAASDALPDLATQPETLSQWLQELPDELGHRPAAPGKWTLKETLAHLIDQERIFADRLLRFARGDAGPLPSFDHEAYAARSGAHGRPLSDLLAEFRDLRRANVRMIRALPAEAPELRGQVAGSAFTVGALAFLMAAHVAHHMRAIEGTWLSK
jgi:hypothetical protein